MKRRDTVVVSLTSFFFPHSKASSKKKKTQVEILLLGEATHGTAEFYSTRTQITLDLLRSGRFHAVCVEADFPDADRVNRWVRGSDASIGDERDALAAFERFPRFMWRNEQVLDLVRGMRALNLQRPDRSQRCWFSGMDVYALSRAADAVVSLLVKQGEPEAARRARARYACFDRFGDEAADYAKGVARGDPGCEGAAVSQLVEMLQREAARADAAAAASAAASASAAAEGGQDDDERAAAAEAAASEDALAALCNARSVVHAEAYYRQLVLGRRSTWNIRDAAMVQTVLLLKAHLEGGVFAADDEEGGAGEEAGRAAPASASASSSPHPRKTKRIIVWAHNSHLGDARATAMSRRGEHNVGQLLRQHFEQRRLGGKGRERVLNLGFSTFSGTVCAAARWGGPPLCRGVRPGMRGSYEELLHRVARLLQSAGGGGGEKEEEEKEQQQRQLSAVAAALNSSSPGAYLLDFRRGAPSSSSSSNVQTAMIDALSEPRLERAIGVLYVRLLFSYFSESMLEPSLCSQEQALFFPHALFLPPPSPPSSLQQVPRTERYSHYFAAELPAQFDLLVHVDESSALSPLDFEEEAVPTLERWKERVIGPDDPVESEE